MFVDAVSRMSDVSMSSMSISLDSHVVKDRSLIVVSVSETSSWSWLSHNLHG